MLKELSLISLLWLPTFGSCCCINIEGFGMRAKY